MSTYRIRSSQSGAALGNFEAEDEAGALDAMARDAGYRDHADACEQSGDDGAHLVVTRVEPIDLTTAYLESLLTEPLGRFFAGEYAPSEYDAGDLIDEIVAEAADSGIEVRFVDSEASLREYARSVQRRYQPTQWTVEGRGRAGDWSREYVEAVGGEALFSSEAEATSALHALMAVCNWPRDELRVRQL